MPVTTTPANENILSKANPINRNLRPKLLYLAYYEDGRMDHCIAYKNIPPTYQRFVHNVLDVLLSANRSPSMMNRGALSSPHAIKEFCNKVAPTAMLEHDRMLFEVSDGIKHGYLRVYPDEAVFGIYV